jgi:Domain of unknown function (DUF6438)
MVYHKSQLLLSGMTLALLFLSACSTTLRATEWKDLVMTLERTECYGPCPDYRLTINGDGSVVYEGRNFVKVTGRQTTTISQERMRQLVSEFEKANFFSLADSYEQITVLDNPTVIMSITIDGKSKTVRHYHGDKTAPKILTDLENKIDEIANSNQWVGR